MMIHTRWILAAAMGLGGAAFVGCDRNDAKLSQKSSDQSEDKKVINNKDDAARTAGSMIPGDQIGSGDLTQIYNTVGDAAEDAFKANGFDNFVNKLFEPDRKRIGDFKDTKSADWNNKADTFRNDWKAKYGADFDIDNKHLENWVKVQKAGEDKDKTYANVTIPAGHGLPEVKVPVVKDNQMWKIDLPDDVSGQQLHDRLMKAVDAVGGMKANWPADGVEGNRAVIHHVMAALMGADTSTSGAVPLK